MKVFILCGGYGTRLDHEGKIKAKPMVEIGSKPLLMHLIENFNSQGFNEFVLCSGFNSKSILDYFLIKNRKNISLLKKKKNLIKFNYNKKKINITIDIVFTGINSGTGGRLLIANKILNFNKDFIMTYGDGLSNVDINKLVKFHYKNKAKITLTAVRPKQRYGVLKIKNNFVKYFDNSNKKIDVFINGGFFVISKDCLKRIKNSSIYWEKEPMSFFLKKRKLFAFKHHGFWKSLDTLKDKNEFQEIINSKKIPWKM